MVENKKMLFVCKCYLLCAGKEKKKRNREIIPLIYSLSSVVMVLQNTSFYNDLFSVLHSLKQIVYYFGTSLATKNVSRVCKC